MPADGYADAGLGAHPRPRYSLGWASRNHASATDNTAAARTEQRRSAITNTEAAAQQASDDLERASRLTDNDVVAVIPAPWAIDAHGDPIATSLSVAGSTVTMTIAHRAAGTAYPVEADPQFSSRDSVDEYEAQQADADTASYDEAEAEAYEPGTPEDASPADGAADSDDDYDGDPSAFEDDEPEELTESGPDLAKVNAAGSAGNRKIPSIHNTETRASLLWSPLRQGVGFKSYRPIVPWNILRFKRSTVARGDWELYVARVRALRKASPNPEAAKVDVALQFKKGQKKAQSVRSYSDEFERFRRAYGDMMNNVTPWNEPQVRSAKNPTRNRPFLAARYWVAAQRRCHPKGHSQRCGNIIAGDFAGRPRDLTYPQVSRDRNGVRLKRSFQFENDYIRSCVSTRDQKRLAYCVVRDRRLYKTGDRTRCP